jgi:peptidoglycan/LPS O-acetylase OafA/YrhL
MPAVRLAIYFMAASLRGHENYMVQGWVDTMMIGCVLALLKGRTKWESLHRYWLNGWTAAALGIVGLFLMPALLQILPRPLSGFIGLVVKPGVSAACIGAVMIYLVENPETFAGRILNSPIVRHIGVMSYYGYLFALAAAEFSYFAVERPSLKLRAWLERRNMRSQIKRYSLSSTPNRQTV